MSLETVGIFAIALSLLIGIIFTLVAAIGLLKLNDSMTRLHAPTKAGTVGVGAFLMASIINSYTFQDGSLHELLIMAFLFVTAPVSANFIAKVNIHRRACDALPEPPQDDTWSTLNVPEADLEIEEMTSEQSS
ncbi:monovalent cation/H(+) antiporter subunit G [uncultured Litoreibacter sp.]|uniref:monovalent cation/H(+) antiporter subunit G n=1 Tax=uncultured Litoreibacter sp. TaxID=1392394 RepID=UPI00260293C2|nr:monovalent cation/H(+) antiporter subunit G [uncultured Litoreibacter sp.]